MQEIRSSAKKIEIVILTSTKTKTKKNCQRNEKFIVKLSQFHQHFTSNFLTSKVIFWALKLWVFFWQNEIGKKSGLKMLMKLSIEKFIFLIHPDICVDLSAQRKTFEISSTSNVQTVQKTDVQFRTVNT